MWIKSDMVARRDDRSRRVVRSPFLLRTVKLSNIWKPSATRSSLQLEKPSLYYFGVFNSDLMVVEKGMDFHCLFNLFLSSSTVSLFI